MTSPKRKPMRLTNLRIREISSVDRGAGEHVKIAIMKRRDDDEALDDLSENDRADEFIPDAVAKGVDALFRSVASIISDDALEDKHAALEQTFGQYDDYLREQLAADDPAAHESTTDKGDQTMDPLLQVAKVVAQGAPSRLTKRDWYDEISKRAQAVRQPGDSPEQAFAKYVLTPDGRMLFAAERLAKGDYRVEQSQEEPYVTKAATASPTYEQLRAQATELHKKDSATYPTVDVAFAKVYTMPENRDLVAAEREANRPSAPVEKRHEITVGDRVARLAAALARQHRDMTHDAAIEAVLQRNPGLADAYRREQSGEAAYGFSDALLLSERSGAGAALVREGLRQRRPKFSGHRAQPTSLLGRVPAAEC